MDTGRRSCSAPGPKPAGTFSLETDPTAFLVRPHKPAQEDYRNVDFLEHLGASASVQQSDVLRRGHDDRTYNTNINAAETGSRLNLTTPFRSGETKMTFNTGLRQTDPL